MKLVVTDLMAGPAVAMWQYVERVDRRVPVTPAATVEWVAVAHGARLSARLLANVRQPTANSGFAQLDELYPFDSVAVFTRGYLSASLEHLLLWADYAAPLTFHPEQEVNFALRPAYTLARAALVSRVVSDFTLRFWDNGVCLLLHRYCCGPVMSPS